MESRSIAIVMTAVAAVVACAEVGPQPTGPTALRVPAFGWQNVAPPGAGVAVQMPGFPRIQTRTTDLGWGQLRGLEAELTNGNVFLGFGVIEYPSDLMGALSSDQLLEQVAGGAIREVGAGQVRSSDTGVHDGFAVLQVDYVAATGVTVRLRILRGATRIFFFTTVVPTAQEAAFEPVVTRFLGSAQLDPAQRLRRDDGDGLLVSGPNAWRWIVPDDVQYGFEMPGAPARREGEVIVGATRGHGVTFRVAAAGGPVGYQLRAVASGRPKQELLDGLRDEMTRAGHRLRQERPIAVHALSGHAFVFESADVTTLVRVFSLPDGWLEMRVTLNSSHETTDMPEAERFFASLRPL